MSILVGLATGGPVGFAAALVNALIEGATGKSVFGHALAMLGFESATPAQAGSEAPAPETPLQGQVALATSSQFGAIQDPMAMLALKDRTFLLNDDMVRLGALPGHSRSLRGSG